MAISRYTTKVHLVLTDKIKNPIPNTKIRIYFNTSADDLLGGYNPSSVNEIATTNEDGVIDLTITHQGTINNDNVKAEVQDDDGNEIFTFNVPKLLWKPALNGETGANYKWSYSESNGEAIGKGFILNQGFENTNNWKVKFEFRHDDIQYTGICFLTKLGEYNGGGGNSSMTLTTWEGSWPGGENYYNGPLDWQPNNDGRKTVDWFDVTITKIDSTHVRLQSITLNRDTIVEVSWLPTATQLSFGARHNDGTSSIEASKYGPCRIRNIEVLQYYDD